MDLHIKNMETIRIKHFSTGWYSFKDIPQGYIKVDSLNCGTDEKALKQAKKLNSDYDYKIVDMRISETEITAGLTGKHTI